MRAKSETLRIAQIVLGVILLVVSPIVGGPLIPGPFGFIGSAMGLALILRNSRWARRRYIQAKRRYPKLGHWIDIGLRRRRRHKQAAPVVLPVTIESRQSDRAV